MAKKSSGLTTLGHIGAFCAFFGVFISGLFFCLDIFDVVASGNEVARVFTMIADWMLLIAVTFVGWSYLRTTNLPGPDLLWTIIYIVFVALAFMGTLGL